jgi:glycosyltransferase involved in cell wall biosynthesis
MNILFVTIAWPEKGRRNLYTDLMSEFSSHGHSVTVLCSREKSAGKPDSFEHEDGIKVLRVKTGNIKKSGTAEKALSLMFLGRNFRKGVRRYLADSEFDLILFNTPPITLSGFLQHLKKRYSAPLYLLLKDMWPYGFADFGVIKEGGMAYNYLLRHEKRIFEISDHIGCMSPKGVDFVLNNYPEMDRDKVEVSPNSMKITRRSDSTNDNNSDNRVRAKYGIPDDATVFIFSGNLGLGHGLDFLVESIIKLKSYEKAFFLIGGAGTHFSRIKKRMDEENPPNAYMYSYLPDEDFKELMSVCDVGLILLDCKYSYPQFPSRLLGYLHDKMAVLCAVNRETDIGDIVERNEAGLSTIHGDLDGFMNAIYKLCENSGATKEMGRNGFDLLQREYSAERSFETIMSHYQHKLTAEDA